MSYNRAAPGYNNNINYEDHLISGGKMNNSSSYHGAAAAMPAAVPGAAPNSSTQQKMQPAPGCPGNNNVSNFQSTQGGPPPHSSPNHVHTKQPMYNASSSPYTTNTNTTMNTSTSPAMQPYTNNNINNNINLASPLTSTTTSNNMSNNMNSSTTTSCYNNYNTTTSPLYNAYGGTTSNGVSQHAASNYSGTSNYNYATTSPYSNYAAAYGGAHAATGGYGSSYNGLNSTMNKDHGSSMMASAVGGTSNLMAASAGVCPRTGATQGVVAAGGTPVLDRNAAAQQQINAAASEHQYNVWREEYYKRGWSAAQSMAQAAAQAQAAQGRAAQAAAQAAQAAAQASWSAAMMRRYNNTNNTRPSKNKQEIPTKLIPCGYFNAGYCWFGNRCHYSHDLEYSDLLRSHWLNPDDQKLKRQVEERLNFRCISFKFDFMQKETDSHILIMDLHGKADEIIEFPCILINNKGKEVSRFHRWVSNHNGGHNNNNQSFESKNNPMNNRAVVSFPDLLDQFGGWMAANGLDASQPGSTPHLKNKFMIAICGNFDLKILLPRIAKLHNVQLPSCFTEWCNVRDVFNKVHNLHIIGMKGALNHLKLLDQNGVHAKHGFPGNYGMHDVENIAKIVQDCWQLGNLSINAKFDPEINLEGNINVESYYDKDPCGVDTRGQQSNANKMDQVTDRNFVYRQFYN